MLNYQRVHHTFGLFHGLQTGSHGPQLIKNHDLAVKTDVPVREKLYYQKITIGITGLQEIIMVVISDN